MFGAIFSHQNVLRNIWPYRWKIVSLFLCLFSVVCFFFSHNKAIVPQPLVMLQYSELENQILTRMWGCDPAGGGNMKSEPSRSGLQITEGSCCSSSTWHWCHPDMLGSYCERAKLKYMKRFWSVTRPSHWRRSLFYLILFWLWSFSKWNIDHSDQMNSMEDWCCQNQKKCIKKNLQ